MKQKPTNTSYYINTNEFDGREQTGTKLILSKLDNELFDEEKAVAQDTIRVKRIGLNNKMEKWRIAINDRVVFTVDGMKISKKQKEFLRSIDGVKFLIKWAKEGLGSLSELKSKLKKQLK